MKSAVWRLIECIVPTFTVMCVTMCCSACTSGRSVDDDSSNLVLSDTTASGITGADGLVSIPFTVLGSSRAFQIVTFSGAGQIRLISLRDPQGTDITALTSEVARKVAFTESSPHTVNYPFASGSVSSGTYSATYQLLDARARVSLGGAELRLSVIQKSDIDLGGGTLKVNIIFVGPVANAEDVRDSIHDAVEIWKLIYNRGGIALDPQLYELDGPSTLPSPRSGHLFYEQAATLLRPDAVNLYFGVDVQGLGTREDEFGLAGSVPGPALPSVKSAIALSITDLTGRDGRFDYEDTNSTEVHNDETRNAAEEMARLTARYLGLESIVTLSSSDRVSVADSLPDTESCVTYTDCRLTKEVRSNLMFPFPVREFGREEEDREFYPRDNITDDQRAVLNRNVLVE